MVDMPTGKLPGTIRRIIIIVLAGLLILYHGYTIHELHGSSIAFTGFDHVQVSLKCIIIASLALVIANIRLGLWGMWFGILALIGTQYWAHFGFQTAEFTEGRSLFSYLRGFIVPVVVTIVFPDRD